MFKIDSHVHIYPDKIAAKAAKGIGRFYDITIHHDGSITQMIAEEDRAGISRMIAHSVATTPTQVAHINEFIMSARDEYPDRIIPFAALHPDTPDMGNAVSYTHLDVYKRQKSSSRAAISAARRLRETGCAQSEQARSANAAGKSRVRTLTPTPTQALRSVSSSKLPLASVSMPPSFLPSR